MRFDAGDPQAAIARLRTFSRIPVLCALTRWNRREAMGFSWRGGLMGMPMADRKKLKLESTP